MDLGKDEEDYVRTRLGRQISQESMDTFIAELRSQEFVEYPTGGPTWTKIILNNRAGKGYVLEPKFD